MDLHIVSRLLKFAEDTKFFGKIENKEDNDTMQSDLQKLKEYADRFGMEFNITKCKRLHLGRKNPCFKYKLDGVELMETKEERDLGVIVQNTAKVNMQCAKVVNTANKVWFMIKRNITIEMPL